MVLWPLSPPRLSWSGPPPSQADCGVPQQQCLAPTLTPSPVISSQPAYAGLRVHFWRGKLLPENPLKGSAPSQRTQWFHFHGHNTELMVFGCLPALSLPCDYFCLWHNLPSPSDFWMVVNCFPQKAFEWDISVQPWADPVWSPCRQVTLGNGLSFHLAGQVSPLSPRPQASRTLFS